MNIFLAFITLFLLFTPVLGLANSIKEPNVAGAFYSADSKELSAQIDSFIQQVPSSPVNQNIQAIIVPHAGYIYSGSVAAYGYKAASKNRYKTIVILAPSHYFPFEGISIWPKGSFKTPLGSLKVDEDLAQQLLEADSQFQSLPHVFEKEHALEVQLPFIQKSFGEVKIVPILMGHPDPRVCQTLASKLSGIIGSREDVLVVASSDMSHYLTYEKANAMDQVTLQAISQDDPQKVWEGCFINRQMEMCGALPVITVLLYAKERGLKPQVLKYANSGDTAGDKSKVVGYSSVIFYKQKIESVLELNAQQKKDLLNLARVTVDNFVKGEKLPGIQTRDVRLLQTQGAFVTLTKQGQLRGCIGHIIGQKSLWETVQEVAVAAASQDPRFSPVSPEELKDIHVEVSVLSVPKRVEDAAAIVLGRDGVIVSDGGVHQGVFLPQVADETGWSKEEFLSELCRQKAGLPSDCWRDSKNQLFTFTADVFSEE